MTNRILSIFLFSMSWCMLEAQSRVQSIPFGSLDIQYTKVDSVFDYGFACTIGLPQRATFKEKYKKELFCNDTRNNEFLFMMSTLFNLKGLGISYIGIWGASEQGERELLDVYDKYNSRNLLVNWINIEEAKKYQTMYYQAYQDYIEEAKIERSQAYDSFKKRLAELGETEKRLRISGY